MQFESKHNSFKKSVKTFKNLTKAPVKQHQHLSFYYNNYCFKRFEVDPLKMKKQFIAWKVENYSVRQYIWRHVQMLFLQVRSEIMALYFSKCFQIFCNFELFRGAIFSPNI